ncbi:MAG: HAD family hydrolase [Vicinamibacterales bacterium]
MTRPDDSAPRPLHAIIFDFDGVIADSERLHFRAYQDVLAEDGVAFTQQEYLASYLGYDDVGMFRQLAKDRGLPMDEARLDALIERKGARYEALAAAGGMIFPGAAEFIRIAAAAVPIAIASGALSHEIHDVLDRVGLRALFPVIVGADHTERSKPAPDPYLHAFERLAAASGRELDPRRSVAIEDSRWGLDSARGAGLRTVAVTNTYAAAELADAAELVVSGLDAVTLEALDDLCAS